jgi:hypothetical protein
MSKAAIRRPEQHAFTRFALCFEFQAQNCDVSLSRACVECDDDVPLENLLEHFLLIPSSRQNWHLCSRVAVMMWVLLFTIGDLRSVQGGLWVVLTAFNRAT